jgi:hypothetical protein
MHVAILSYRYCNVDQGMLHTLHMLQVFQGILQELVQTVSSVSRRMLQAFFICMLHIFSHICCNSMFQNISFVSVFCCNKYFHVASFKCSIWILHMFSHICCKCIFQMFYLFQMYVISVFIWMLHMLHWLYTYVTNVCFNCFTLFRYVSTGAAPHTL